MRHLFLAELQQLGDDLVSMAQQVEQAIVHAGNALRDQDIALAETVIAEDVAIDEMERVLDERCINPRTTATCGNRSTHCRFRTAHERLP